MTSIQIYDTDADRLYEKAVITGDSIAQVIQNLLDDAEYLEAKAEREGLDD